MLFDETRNRIRLILDIVVHTPAISPVRRG
jgi:hypothetical protein